MQHARHAHVIDIAAIAQREFACFVLRACATNDIGERWLECLASCDPFDGVEHLHVSGATTQVSAQVSRHIAALEVGTLLVDLRLSAHHNAGDTEAALQSATRCKRVGESIALFNINAFQRDDRLAFNLRDRLLTADHSLAIDEHRATATLPAWRATIFGRRDVELVAQGRQQVRVIATHADRRAIHDEWHGRWGSRFSHVLHFVKVGTI